MSELNITEVTIDNFSETMTRYISEKSIKITDIDSMIETYVSMLNDHYLFKFDRDLLKDMLVDLTYMYSPNDDANKDRVLYHLVGSDDESDDSDDDTNLMQKLTDMTEHLRNNVVQTGDDDDGDGDDDDCKVEEVKDSS